MVAAWICMLEWGKAQQRYNRSASSSTQQKAASSAFVLKPNNSVLLCISLMLFELLPQCWGLERVSPSVSSCMSHLRGAPGTVAALISLGDNVPWFLQPEVVETSLPSPKPGEAAVDLGLLTFVWRTLEAEIVLPIFNSHTRVWHQPILGFCSYSQY